MYYDHDREGGEAFSLYKYTVFNPPGPKAGRRSRKSVLLAWTNTPEGGELVGTGTVALEFAACGGMVWASTRLEETDFCSYFSHLSRQSRVNNSLLLSAAARLLTTGSPEHPLTFFLAATRRLAKRANPNRKAPTAEFGRRTLLSHPHSVGHSAIRRQRSDLTCHPRRLVAAAAAAAASG